MGSTLLYCAIVLALIIVEGVFVAAEIALVSLRDGQVRTMAEAGRRGAAVARLTADPNRFLAAVQIGVTSTALLSSAFGAVTLSDTAKNALVRAGWGEGLAHAVGLIGVTLVISFVTLVLGELAPKRLALQRAESAAMFFAPPLNRIAGFFRPVIWLLSKSTDLIVRLLGGDPTAAREPISEDELRGLVASHEALSSDNRLLIDQVFAASERTVSEVMISRTEVTFLDASLTVSRAAKLAVESPVESEDSCAALALKEEQSRHALTLLKRQGRILVAEDNITNQHVVLAILRKLGCRADAVANGKEAVAALRNVPYDLVLMDCQMPEMNGYDAAALIRDSRSGVRNRHVPVVALTANVMKGDREKCLASGMDDYIAKPIHPDTLAAVLRRWLPAASGFGTGAAVPESAAHAQPCATPAPAFDEAALLERLMGDRDLARTIAGGFLEDVPKQLSALAGHLAAGDAFKAQRLAHTIHGAAATAGADGLKRVAFVMEEAGKTGNLSAMAAQYPELEWQFHTAREAMRSMQGDPVQRIRTLL